MFPDGVQVAGKGEFNGTAGFPRCIFRMGASRPDDHNELKRKVYDCSIEVQQQVLAAEAGDAAYFGAHRQNTDEAATAGLIDIDAKLVTAAGYYTTSDDAELNSYIQYEETTGFDFKDGGIAYCILNFKAALVVV